MTLVNSPIDVKFLNIGIELLINGTELFYRGLELLKLGIQLLAMGVKLLKAGVLIYVYVNILRVAELATNRQTVSESDERPPYICICESFCLCLRPSSIYIYIYICIYVCAGFGMCAFSVDVHGSETNRSQ